MQAEFNNPDFDIKLRSEQDKKNIIQNKIYTEKIKLLNRNLIYSIPANFICFSVVFFSLFHITNISLLWSWYIAMVLISLYRFSAYYIYKKYPQDKVYLYIFILGVVLSSLLWGFADSYMMPNNNVYDQMIIMSSSQGITAGGVQSLQANIVACFFYIILIVLPLSTWLFYKMVFPILF